MNLPDASIGVSEIQEQAHFYFARKDPADILGIPFATKVTPTFRIVYPTVGGSLLPISGTSNFTSVTDPDASIGE